MRVCLQLWRVAYQKPMNVYNYRQWWFWGISRVAAGKGLVCLGMNCGGPALLVLGGARIEARWLQNFFKLS